MLPVDIQFLHRGAKPSHGWLHVVAIGCEVNVAGMTVADGDIVHADRHGAAVVPEDVVRELPDAAAGLRERDAALLEACRTPGADIGNLLTLLSGRAATRSEEHTSELQALMRISYAVFRLKKKN